MTGPSLPSLEQDYADQVAESVYSSVDDHYFAELWIGRWTTSDARPVLITAGRAKDAKYLEVLGHDLGTNGSPGWTPAELGLAIYENIEEPSPWKYDHGLIVIGGGEADSLNDAWQDDLALSAQWGGLTRQV
jgi:hypothetical protein